MVVTRNRMIGAAIGTALVAGAIALGGSSGTAVEPPPADFVFASAGRIEFVTTGSATGSLTYYPAGGGTPVVQDLDLNRCEVRNVAAGSGTLLAITPSTAKVGLVSNGLGVRTKNNCSTDGGLVGPAEALTLSLNGSSLPDNVLIDYAVLDVEGKYDAEVFATADGSSAAPYGVIPLVNDSDNGPDSGGRDNNLVTVGTIDAPDTPAATRKDFRTLMLQPTGSTGGEISLEGGGDYETVEERAANKTIFHLVKSNYDVFCGEAVTRSFDGVVRTATFVRAADAFKNDGCLNIGVVLTLDAQGRLLLDTTGDVPLGQELSGTMTIEWVINRFKPNGDLKTAAEINAELAREVDFAPGAPEEFVAVQWCETTANGIEHPADAPWCLVSDDQVLDGDLIIQTQVYDGEEDPMWR